MKLPAPALLVLLLAPALTAQSFVPTGSMIQARFYHTATLLNNGTVLVTGGHNGVDLNTAEVYDPATGTWRYTQHAMNFARYAHTAVKLLGGRVLIAGGTGSPTPAEIFDPVTETFTLTGPMNTTVGVCPGLLFDDGRVLILRGSLWFFGVGASEVYDPATNAWTLTPSIPVGQSGMAVAKAPDGTALAIGGYDGYTPSAYGFVESYSVTANTVRDLAVLQVGRLNHTVTVMQDGTILVVAGTDQSYSIRSTEIYDASILPNGRSVFSTSLNEKRRAHTATLLPNGDLLVTGGYQARHGGPVDADLASAELRDHTSKNWTLVGPMAAPRGEGHTATLLPSGRVLVAGGIASHSNPAPMNTAELWGPRYSVCLLYDPTRAAKAGSTIPIKLELCDSAANDVSSAGITAHATATVQISTSIAFPVLQAGNANPHNDFRFDLSLGSSGGYIFNLNTTGLSAGTYSLDFTVTGDSIVYTAPFQVR